MHNRLLALIMLIAAFALIGCMDSLVANQERAQPVIEALEQYKAANGIYPQTLDDLVPQYLSELPSTINGKMFTYDTRTDHGYILGFSVRDGRACGYIGAYETWECSSGLP